MAFWQYLFLTTWLTLLVPIAIWYFKLRTIERYVFIYGEADTLKSNPYVIVRLDKLTGEVHGMNWAGWVKIKPHSGYLGSEKPE
jgi:hypothetical protein